LHDHNCPLPAFQETLLAGNHLLHLGLSLVKDLLRLLSLFLLGYDLGSEHILLLLQALALLIHRVNQKILLFLYLLQVSHAVLGCKGLLLCHCDIRF
jgi:hypothetical protein